MAFYIDNKLAINDVFVKDIGDVYDTPIYVYDEQKIIDNIQNYHRSFSQTSLRYSMHYAVKASANIHILRIVAKENMGMDVVSKGEILRCLKAGIDPSHIVFSGVGKTTEEIEFAVLQDIYQFNAESLHEVDDIHFYAKKHQKKVAIAIRVNPDIEVKTHEKISTGKKGDKFGIAFEEIKLVVEHILSLPFLVFTGLAMHIGSQIQDLESFKPAYRKLKSLLEEINMITPVKRIDIGGGRGIVYDPEKDSIVSMESYAKMVEEYFSSFDAEIMLEPGRSIVADAGYVLTKVVRIKNNGNKLITIIDAAMNDFIRPTLYDGYHSVLHATKKKQKTIQDFVGPICETGDYFLKNEIVETSEKGDLLLFCNAGAYGAVMASSYNARPIIGEVLITKDKKMKYIRKPITVEDLLTYEMIHEKS